MVVAVILAVPFCPKYDEVRVAKTSGIFKHVLTARKVGCMRRIQGPNMGKNMIDVPKTNM